MDEQTVATLKSLIEVGGTAIVTAMLYLVWSRLNEITDRLFDILEKLSAQSKDNET